MDIDEFADDGIDDLSDSDLQAIDQLAVHFTQAAQSQAPPRQTQNANPPRAYPNYNWDEDDDLDTTEVTNDAGGPVGRPLNPSYQHQKPSSQLPQRPVPPVPNPRWNPTVPPGRPATTMPSSRSLLAMNLSQQVPSQSTSGFGRNLSQFPRPPVPQPDLAPSQAPSANMVSALQKRVRALEAELASARSEVNVVRNNSLKAEKQHAAELAAEVARLKKLNSEELAKHEKITEAALVAKKHANTELEFLQRDLREVNDRARRKDTAPMSTVSGPDTPRKNKTWGIADGFDDMDIVTSPSKTQGRFKNSGPVAIHVGERTPTKGKRKRPMVESPITALETHVDDVFMAEDREPPPVQNVVVAAPTEPFEFLPLVLDHGAFHNQPPTFDVLSRLAFPSDPDTSLSSLIFQRLPLLGNPSLPMQLFVDFSELIINLWIRCCEEAYLEPIKYLASLLAFVFQLETTSVAPVLAPKLVPVLLTMINTLAETRQRIPEGQIAKDADYNRLEEHVHMKDMLGLLHTLALACATAPSDNDAGLSCGAAEFWKLMTLKPVYLLLAPKEKHEHTVGMLHLLALSSLPSSIGPITQDEAAEGVAQMIIERASARLTEFPRTVSITPKQRRDLRLAALRTLIGFARHPFGTLQLATHNSALPRVATCLSNCIDELYDQAIPSGILPPPDTGSTAELFAGSSSSGELCQIISQCILLIYKLVTDPATSDVLDISQKLSTSNGGNRRYHLALGRLAFAEEDLVLESGIDSEIVEAAAELLEMAVTPDEGELMSEAFGPG
ncbi:hypothetical protein B0I35DRAFT_348538 [Stachybotrys elegans]|uniref:DNA repair protein Rad26 n=1 Tax=Stachybotrys elegans TaxID=80388 RepID=A0A8K0SUA1_9HYPO|nr:hypothetical protein B0I35DRAFT_348538 [Stachybotrys elegans]